MNKTHPGLTLIELLIAVALLAVMILTITHAYFFIFTRVVLNLKRANIEEQITYALENIRLHCISAAQIYTPFIADYDSEKNVFSFKGERNIYNITPSNPDDDTLYCYSKDTNGNLVLYTGSCDESAANKEILVDAQHKPSITFSYTAGNEPNFMRVTIEARINASEPRVHKSEAIRFWFVDVARI